MSQIYLTKIERKTIFTKSLIYVLIMFIVADLTVTGPFWFNFVPWLFLLSVLGTVKGVEKILTCIIGTFTVFVSSVITQGALNIEAATETAIALVQMVFGALTGKAIFEFVLEHRLVKYLRPRRKVLLIALMIVFTIVSYGLVSSIKGDVFSYVSSKQNLDKYIFETYNMEYDVKKVVYGKEFKGNYAYVVNMDNEEVYFIPVTKTIFKDANQEERLEKINNDLKIKGRDILKNILSNSKEYKILKEENISFVYEYTRVGVTPNDLVMYIECEKEEKGIYKELANVINAVANSELGLTKVSLSIENKALNILELGKVNEQYIKDGLLVEDLDE